jgi:hypothetical protein
MGERITKAKDRVKETALQVKEHVVEYKEAYVVGAVGAAGMAATYLVGKGRAITITNAATNTIGDLAENATVNIDQSMTTIIELVRRGHPGFKIQCVETGETFASIRRAAKVMGVNPGNLSKHLNGEIPHVGGHTFMNLGEMA